MLRATALTSAGAIGRKKVNIKLSQWDNKAFDIQSRHLAGHRIAQDPGDEVDAQLGFQV